MEKQSFGVLVGAAFARSGEGRFTGVFLLGSLVTTLLFLPLFALIAYGIFVGVRADEQSSEFPVAMLLWAVPLALLFYFLAAWFGAAIMCGVGREALYPAPSSSGRAFRAGFARRLTVLFPVPWVIGAGVASAVAQGAARLGFTPVLSATLPTALNLAVGVVTAFMYAAVAVEPAAIGFSALYAKVFAALKNGWGRMILGQLLVAGAVIVGMLCCLPGVICLVAAKGDPKLMTAGGILLAVWLIALIVLMFRLWTFQLCYQVMLYADAAGANRPDIPEP